MDMEGGGAFPADPALLLDAASDFAAYPGLQNDASTKEFLDRFPLPVIFGMLRDRADVRGLESSLTSCLEKIFKTKYGASLIPQYITFVQAGLQADSQEVQSLACKAVYFLIENTEDLEKAVWLIMEYSIYPMLITCLLEGNELVAASSSETIKKLASSPGGVSVIFPENEKDDTHLKKITARCPSLARIRILALIAKLFSLSSTMASTIHQSNLLSLFLSEISSTNDMLVNLSILELFYEIADSPHSTEFLLKTTLLQILTTMISNDSVDPVLRSRAILLCGRLLSASDTYHVVDEHSVKTCLVSINRRLELLEGQETDERESAVEALGQIGNSFQGATLLLLSPSPAARHVVSAAFHRGARGIILAGLDALGNIAGVNHSESSMVLDSDAEECLRRLIYLAAANTSKVTPSGLFLSVLQQEPEIRLAAYRLISALVVRSWCLVEICSKQQIINIVTDANVETNKNGMDARYHCCTSISKALSASSMVNDPALTGVMEKLYDAVKRGPYLPKRQIEAQPVVITADRF